MSSNNIYLEFKEDNLDNETTINSISDLLLDNQIQNYIEDPNKESKYTLTYNYNYNDFDFNEPSEERGETETEYSKLTKPELMRICEFYSIECSKMKLKKEQIIQLIYTFEDNIHNEKIVSYRKELWYYMDVLRNDKILKKYVIILPAK